MSKFLTAVAVAASLAIATVAAATTADARRVVHTGVPVPPGVAPGGVERHDLRLHLGDQRMGGRGRPSGACRRVPFARLAPGANARGPR